MPHMAYVNSGPRGGGLRAPWPRPASSSVVDSVRRPVYAASRSRLRTTERSLRAAMRPAGISTALDMSATGIRWKGVLGAVRAGERAPAYGLGRADTGARRGRSPWLARAVRRPSRIDQLHGCRSSVDVHRRCAAVEFGGTGGPGGPRALVTCDREHRAAFRPRALAVVGKVQVAQGVDRVTHRHRAVWVAHSAARRPGDPRHQAADSAT